MAWVQEVLLARSLQMAPFRAEYHSFSSPSARNMHSRGIAIHIHAKYAEFEASIKIEDGELLAGELPRKQLRLVQAWIELHKDELFANWEIAVNGENPYKIRPL